MRMVEVSAQAGFTHDAKLADPTEPFLSEPQNYRYLFRLGLNTLEIAQLFKTTEASVFNYLAKQKGLTHAPHPFP